MQIRNNYDVMAEQARLLFLGYDQQALCRRLSLPCGEEYIRFIDPPEGMTEP